MKYLIDRLAALDVVIAAVDSWDGRPSIGLHVRLEKALMALPYTQSDDWMEKNKDRILQAGTEGIEVEFRIGGRLFAIREKAQ